MRVFKKSVLVFIALMVNCLLFAAVYAADTECGSIAYFDAGGNRITGIAGGDTVVAKMRVKSSASQKLTMLLMLYDNDKLVECALDAKTAGDDITEYSAKLTVPANVSDPRLETVLWDSLKQMKPICTASTFGSNNELLGIYVNGTSLDDFDPEKTEYVAYVSPDETKVPTVTAEAADGGTRIIVKNPTEFPGEAEVKAIAADGTESEKTYKIKYQCKEALVDNINFPEAAVKAKYAGQYAYKEGLKAGFVPFADRGAVSITDDEMLGKAYIMGSLTQYEGTSGVSDLWNNPETVWYTFDLKRPAVVEVYSENALGKSKWKDIGTMTTLPGNKPYFGFGWGCKVKYTKKYEPGTVEIYPTCTDSGMFVTLVYDGYTEPADENKLDY